jgi:pilus assembly protein CpaE
MRTFIVGDNEITVSRVREVLLQEGQDCPAAHIYSLSLAADQVPQARPELTVVILNPEPEGALATVATLRRDLATPLLVVGPTTDSRLVLSALRLGANDYVDEIELESELRAALARLPVETGSAGMNGRIIALLGPSGGSGSSTLAVNLATMLAREHQHALLLDLNLHTGDIATLMDIKPVHTLADLCQKASRMDRVMFEGSLASHHSGVRLLAAPRKFTEISHINPERIRQVLHLGRDLYPYVVVDLDHGFGPEQLSVLRLADEILLVLRLDFTCLRNVQRTLDYLGELGISRDRVQVVVNRYGQAKEIPAGKAEEALGIKLTHYIPDDPKTVNRANNNGVPVVLESPWSKVSRRLGNLAASVNGKHP